MINIYLTQGLTDDDPADNKHSREKLNKVQNVTNRQRLAKIFHRASLGQTNYCDQVIWCREVSKVSR